MKRLAAFVLALLLICSSLSAAPGQRPNIVLILADDLGYGDLGCYGHPSIRTPNIDRLASRGVKLTSFYAAPTCGPSRTQLITGKYHHRIDFGGSTGPSGGACIPDTEITVAEALKSAGYATAMQGKWHLGNGTDKSLPTGQGFDTWLGLPYSNDMILPWVRTNVPLWLYDSTAGSRPTLHPVSPGFEMLAPGDRPPNTGEAVPQHELTARYTEHAVKFIREQRDQPFFVYLSHSMVHLPLYPGEKFRGRSRAGLYGDTVEELDWSVGEVMKALEETGQADNTIVIFTSDNGPWSSMPPRMRQQGNELWHAGTTGLLRGAKGSTYEGGVRVPAIIHWAGHFEGGWSTAEMTSNLDLYATLVALGTGAPPRQPTDGFDLTEFLSRPEQKSPRDEFYFFNSLRLDGVRVGPWKLLLRDSVELYHLDLDPSERYNRSADFPDLVDELTQRLEIMAATPRAVKSW